MQLGQILDNKIQEDQKNPTATSEELGAKAGVGRKAGYCTCLLHKTPPKGWEKHLSLPSGPTPGHTPTLTLGEQARETVTFFHSPLLQQGPQ